MSARTRLLLSRTLHLPPPTRGLRCYRRHLSILAATTHSKRRQQWNPKTVCRQQTRLFALSSIPSVLLPPVVFLGLLVSLWTWKSIIAILFQDKIIYMPYMPPFARSEKLSTSAAAAHPVIWTEETIKSLDNKTRLVLAIGTIPTSNPIRHQNEVIICYFQGNGSSIPPRTPQLSSILTLLSLPPTGNTEYTIAALSYRGYWTSTGRPTQSGIEQDAQAFLHHLVTTHPNAHLVLWGQSVGAGVACTAAAAFKSPTNNNNNHPFPFVKERICALILETPFTSIKAMLLAVYESKWLPYRYLSPFLWNRWDSEAALKTLAGKKERNIGGLPKILLLPAGKDELVPKEEVGKLEVLCRGLGFEVQRREVRRAFHTEATSKREGQAAVARFIRQVVEETGETKEEDGG